MTLLSVANPRGKDLAEERDIKNIDASASHPVGNDFGNAATDRTKDWPRHRLRFVCDEGGRIVPDRRYSHDIGERKISRHFAMFDITGEHCVLACAFDLRAQVVKPWRRFVPAIPRGANEQQFCMGAMCAGPSHRLYNEMRAFLLDHAAGEQNDSALAESVMIAQSLHSAGRDRSRIEFLEIDEIVEDLVLRGRHAMRLKSSLDL